MVHMAESTVGRRYAGWFIRNTEHAQRVLDTLRNSPLPIPVKPQARDAAPSNGADGQAAATISAPRTGGQRVAWGGVKVA